ncbi:tRNA(Ile)-lysidine synthase [Pseudoalteromonas espejiana DSM 9414]|uniref:tRNA(Ile)-lysidine synthase n=1 Tax=Pseudoalteromonas espejiana TaxID=28107 RepID=A0A510XXL3_9GAMM|nr:tRNA lysidine(34) synthetase TilS [Pseudoalteromonas espejiana]ASM50570.1 tRNA(Ile)-lysidine synthase [Pseudoalteromonas espejiana DSM 9414]GEK55371.1 tRNA(Ile)-lysidine synthase [Pseudoalteromonas espejiana]
MQSSAIYQQVKHSLAHFFKQQQYSFTVALSGGVDSVVLLHLMHLLKQEQPKLSLSAIYVNHGLSQYADDWQQFCHTLCAELNVPFSAAAVHIAQKSRTSLEAQARDARYKALDELSAPESIILLGQHLNDQIETFLLRLKRGSGLKGLGAMQQTRTLKSGRTCFRPLLNVTRSSIEAFAAQFTINHITDDSNTDEQFDRNFLRASVVPVLAERFSGFEHCAGRSINLLQQQQALLDEYTELDLQHSLNSQQGLCISQITAFSDIRISNVVRAWLNLFTQVMPSHKQLSQIINQAISAQADAQMQVDLTDGQVRRHQGHLYFVSPQQVLIDETFNGNELTLKDGRLLIKLQGKGVRAPLENEQVTVRFNCNSARIKPLKKPGSNTLKHWFKDAKVAPWLRAQVPLIFYNDELVQVVGYFISEKHKDENGIFWECK